MNGHADLKSFCFSVVFESQFYKIHVKYLILFFKNTTLYFTRSFDIIISNTLKILFSFEIVFEDVSFLGRKRKSFKFWFLSWS